MRASVRTIWPDYIDDFGKAPRYAVLLPGDHPPTWRLARFSARAEAQAHADRMNATRGDWIAR